MSRITHLLILYLAAVSCQGLMTQVRTEIDMTSRNGDCLHVRVQIVQPISRRTNEYINTTKNKQIHADTYVCKHIYIQINMCVYIYTHIRTTSESACSLSQGRRAFQPPLAPAAAALYEAVGRPGAWEVPRLAMGP